MQVMPRTSYVVQSDQTAFRQAGLPVAQNPARCVTGTQAQTLSAAATGTVKTVDTTDAVAGRCYFLYTLAGDWLLPADTQPER